MPKHIYNLIVISGNSQTGKTVLTNELATILPNCTIISTDSVQGQAIKNNIISNYGYSNDPKSKHFWGRNLGVILNKLTAVDKQKLYKLIEVELDINIPKYSSIITEGYLWKLPEYTKILSKYSNICFVERIKGYKSIITINNVTFTVTNSNLNETAFIIRKAIRDDAIVRVKPMYNWYQEFEFLHGKSSSRSNLKLKALNLPQDLIGLNVLDIGHNTGFFSIECDKRGADVIGIESIESIVDIANLIATSIYFTKKTTFHTMNINDNLSTLGTFSYILVLGLFHYLNNQQEIIHKLMNLLKPDGVLKLEVGIFQRNTNEIKVLKGKYYPTESKLKDMLKNYNFTINTSVNQVGDSIPRFIISIKK